jgi:hypothetical protein
MYQANVRSMLPSAWMIQKTDQPLGNYAKEWLRCLRETSPDVYWKLVFQSSLYEKAREKEQEYLERKITIMAALELKFPRPKTDSFLIVANHMSEISKQAHQILLHEIAQEAEQANAEEYGM